MNLSELELELSSRRLIFRTLQESDASEEYTAWLNNSEINRFLESRFQQHTTESLRDFISRDFHSANSMLLGIFLEDGRHIGTIRLSGVDVNHGTGELGFLIGEKSFWGMGLGTESIEAVSDFAFTSLSIRKLTAGAYSQNTGSIRALEKASFYREALLKHQVIGPDGIPSDVVRLARFLKSEVED